MRIDSRILMIDWDHTSHVDLIRYKIVPVQWLIIFTAELEHNRLSPPEALGKRQTEEAGRIRPGTGTSQCIDRGDLDVSDGQLFIWIRVQSQDGSSQRDWMSPT